MIGQISIDGKDKVQTAIDRLKAFEPQEGYYLAFSGGKDSVVIKALADMAGVKYDAHYNITSVDPPELVRFIKTFKDVSLDRPKDKNGKSVTMWNLIAKRKMPPTRLVRYCCQHLKETQGEGRITVTGVRWAESNKRKQLHSVVSISKGKDMKQLREDPITMTNSRGGVVMYNDNGDARKLVENCYKRNRLTVNPIVDWTEEEVWEFIHKYNIPYCKLYDEGFKRLGCIGCPMSNNKINELNRYPKFKEAYIRAFDRMLENLDISKTGWQSGEDVYKWWISQ